MSCCHYAEAQEYFNLTAPEVRIDSVLPVFTYRQPLGRHYADSVYMVSIEYPEFIDMSRRDIERYRQISGEPLPELPTVSQAIGVSRKQGILEVSLVPLVVRDGKYQKLVSFKLNVQATPRPSTRAQQAAGRARLTAAERYAEHSVLQSGNWAKIRVPASGIYQLTDAVVRRAGFSNAARVKIYGYGGAMQPEKLTGDYLAETDDLKEVPTTTANGRRLFYATGPVTWESNETLTRTRNPYSNYGYYFLTENDDAPLTLSNEEFAAAYYPLAADYHTLYEVDDYAWFHGGRNFFDKTLFSVGTPQTYQLAAPGAGTNGVLTVALTSNGNFAATVTVNGKEVGTINASVNMDEYISAVEQTWNFPVADILESDNTISITQTDGSSVNVRLDYLSLTFDQPMAMPDLQSATFSAPEYVYNITNQDHHADAAVDMVILIPTSQKWVAQAERIKTLHEQRDGLRVRIVPADELYNEFSSGTPDANAYRRYLKMLYDRAETDADMPRYLLLYGDGAWDNRMVTPDWRGYDPDDFLLCYESDNSFSKVLCFVSDDYFCLLDDEEQIQEPVGKDTKYLGKPDMAVGRFPVRTAAEAKILADKTISYANNEYAGAWQNSIVFMGDDGNNNTHMNTADKVAQMVENTYPSYAVHKIYWDAYTRATSSTGNSYPDVTRLIKEKMTEGALIMNYSGHGINYTLSHESVVSLDDFEAPTSLRLPLWLTASCDIMPFDGQEENIGESAMMNKKGGSIAFFGTTRTVYANYNEEMNLAFTRYVLGATDGVQNSIGEAARLAKCDMVDLGKDTSPNKLQYTLLGDPALKLAIPTGRMAVDKINGTALADGTAVHLPAGSVITIEGYVVGTDGGVDTGFNGTVTASVRDAEETIICQVNDPEQADVAFVYKDRTKTLFSGSDSIQNGRFSFTFPVPLDISYTDSPGLITLYGVNAAKTLTANGKNSQFVLNGSGEVRNDSIGPSIYCYLNSTAFTNGSKVNKTPYFVAELYDDSGINASGSSIGHDLELVIDGELSKTYIMNDYFTYGFGNYQGGTVKFSIPELSEGQHKLMFRAWDVLNNSSVTELYFEVAKDAASNISIDCRRDASSDVATFIITHDRAGAELDIQLDIFDIGGRQVWHHTESGVSSDNTYTIDWNMTVDGGRPLMTGAYVYRISVNCDGGGHTSKAKKLIVTQR